MDCLKDNFTFKDNFLFSLFRSTERQTLIHCHDFLEINLIEKGSGHYVIEDKTYPIGKDDIFIINNSERHIAMHSGDLSMIVLIFEPKFILDHPEEYDYLKPFFDRGLSFSNRIDKTSRNFEELHANIKRIHLEYEKKQDGWELIIKAILMLFLALLYRYYQSNQELKQESKDFQKSYARISQVIDYINHHYREGITLEELASQAHMNKTYLSTYFKEVMNIGMFDYIEQMRINQSCILLKTTEMSITEISLEVGFNSVSYFNRIFKRIVGITPRAYRNNPNIVQKH